MQEIFATLRRLNETEGLSILVAEQNATVALRSAHRAYVFEGGAVVLSDTAQRLRARDDIRAFYLGLADPRREPARITETS